jgi:DNA polymerase III subunit delta
MADAPRVYLFYGDDDLAIDNALAQIRTSMGDDANAEMNTSDYQGDEIDVPRLLNEVRSFPFLSDKRLVIVRGLVQTLMKNAATRVQLERLLDDIPTLPAHARLVLIERDTLRKDLKIVKAVQKHGYCKAFTVPKDSTQWIIQRAQHDYQTAIDPQAAIALASVTGSDLRRADNELVKLVSYIGTDDRPISEQDVALLTPYVADANVFDMVDAIATANGKTALSLMHHVLEQDPSDPGFRLFALIVRQFRLLLLVREHLDNGGSADKNIIGRTLGIHPYPAGKLAVQSRRFKIEMLERIYRRLQQYDVEMKTGQVTPRLALELLVASVARE